MKIREGKRSIKGRGVENQEVKLNLFISKRGVKAKVPRILISPSRLYKITLKKKIKRKNAKKL